MNRLADDFKYLRGRPEVLEKRLNPNWLKLHIPYPKSVKPWCGHWEKVESLASKGLAAANSLYIRNRCE